MTVDPDKYVVFKRDELLELFGELALPQGDEPCAPVAEHIIKRVHDTEIHDAVILRKSDKLAAGALHAYATACDTVADVLIGLDLPTTAAELTAIGTYFYQQYEEAHAMQDHLPTL